jgi:hypothetical protein
MTMSEKIETPPQAAKQPPASSGEKTTAPTARAGTMPPSLTPEALRARGFIVLEPSGKGYGLPMGNRPR